MQKCFALYKIQGGEIILGRIPLRRLKFYKIPPNDTHHTLRSKADTFAILLCMNPPVKDLHERLF